MRIRSPWTLGVCAALLGSVVLLSGPAARAKQGTVKLTDGRTLEGDITETGDKIIVKMKGGQATLNRQAVAPNGITYGDNPAAEFDQRMGELAPTDAAGRVKLAHWAFDHKLYDQALQAVDSALEIDRRNQEARDLRVTIEQQVQMQRKVGSANGGGGDTGAATTTPPPATARPAGARAPATTAPAATRPDTGGGPPRRMVTPAEVNRIRQVEWRDGENNVRVKIDANIRKRFLDNNAEYSPQQFQRLTPVQQARAILTKGSPEMQQQVTIMSDPPTLLEFRRQVERVILPGCASTQCHGSPGAGLFLYNPADNDQQAYTNFLLLQDYETSVNGKKRAMIDRSRPEDSLLLQYGLPREVADFAHPNVNGYRPVFRGRKDPRFVEVANWASQSLAPVKPEYGIDLTGEGGGNNAAAAAPAGDRAPAETEAPPPAAPPPEQAPPARGGRGTGRGAGTPRAGTGAPR